MEEIRIKRIDVSPEEGVIKPTRKKRKGKKIFFFLLVLVGLGAFFFFKYQEKQPEKAIQNSLQMLKEKKVKELYQKTSVGFKEETSLETFAIFVKQNPSLTKNKTFSLKEKQYKENSVVIKGTLTAEDGTVTPINYKLVKQEGEWKIEGIEIYPTE